MKLQERLEAKAKKQIETDAKLRTIVDSVLAKERAKYQAKLDNLEATRERKLDYYRNKLATTTEDNEREMLQKKLDYWDNIEGRRKHLLEMLESYR